VKETVSDEGHEDQWRVYFIDKGTAYLKERLVILKEIRIGGRARVSIDEESVL